MISEKHLYIHVPKLARFILETSSNSLSSHIYLEFFPLGLFWAQGFKNSHSRKQAAQAERGPLIGWRAACRQDFVEDHSWKSFFQPKKGFFMGLFWKKNITIFFSGSDLVFYELFRNFNRKMIFGGSYADP